MKIGFRRLLSFICPAVLAINAAGADVPVDTKSALWVEADYVSQSPSVKYRGIFINDEDRGLQPWAAKNYEKELGDISPRGVGVISTSANV